MNENLIAVGSTNLSESIVGPFAILGVTMVVAYVGIGFLRVYMRKNKQRMERRVEMMSDLPDRYVSETPRRLIQLQQMLGVVPSFQIGQSLNWVRSLHLNTHRARGSNIWVSIDGYLSEGAKEILRNDVPGLEKLEAIRYSRCRFTTIHANAESAGLRATLHSYTIEHRDGTPTVWEFQDLWSLTKVGDSWRVLAAERNLRQPLQPPSTDHERPETVEDEIRYDPELAIQRAAYLKKHDIEVTERWLKETYTLLYDGLARQDLSGVAARLSPIAAMEAESAMFRFQHFGLKSIRAIDAFTSVQLVQCSEDARLPREVFRIQARIADRIEQANGTPYGTTPKGSYPVNEYWTLVRTPDGKLLLDWVDDDDDWVI
jgi:hypothetical protein